MKRKHLKRHVFNARTDLCVYCGADMQEGHLSCDHPLDSAPDFFERDDPRWLEEEDQAPAEPQSEG